MNNLGATIADPSAMRNRLRHVVGQIEEGKTGLGIDRPALTFGISAIDAVLRGGLAASSLHEIVPVSSGDAGAASGFSWALAARAATGGRDMLWIKTSLAALEGGEIYGPGCDLFGLPLRQLLVLKVARPLDALWAMEEALKSRALACVVTELANDGAAADLVVTRRLTLAAQKSGGFGFLFRHRPSRFSTSAETCWEIAAAPSIPDRFGGLGRTALMLSLIKNRHGRTGRWPVAWDHHERSFSALSLGVAETSINRQDRAPFAVAG